MSTHKIERLTVAESVCARPKMYTAGGSLAEVLALFAGYDLAKRYGSHPIDDSPSKALQWLAKTCTNPSTECLSPSGHIEKILEHFATEAFALESIATFLRSQRKNA